VERAAKPAMPALAGSLRGVVPPRHYCSVTLLLGTDASGRELDHFQFGGPVDGTKQLVDPGHRALIEFRVTALGTFKDREGLQYGDGGVSQFERQIGNAA